MRRPHIFSRFRHDRLHRARFGELVGLLTRCPYFKPAIVVRLIGRAPRGIRRKPRTHCPNAWLRRRRCCRDPLRRRRNCGAKRGALRHPASTGTPRTSDRSCAKNVLFDIPPAKRIVWKDPFGGAFCKSSIFALAAKAKPSTTARDKWRRRAESSATIIGDKVRCPRAAADGWR
jgi:hypothetical protein